MLFSVGATGGAAGADVVVAVVVVVVVEVAGAFCCSLAQDALKPTSARIARPPATAETRRVILCACMFIPILMTCYQLILDP